MAHDPRRPGAAGASSSAHAVPSPLTPGPWEPERWPRLGWARGVGESPVHIPCSTTAIPPHGGDPNPSSSQAECPLRSLRQEKLLENPWCSHLKEVDADLGERLQHIWDRSGSVGVCTAIPVLSESISAQFLMPIRGGDSRIWSTLGGDSRSFAQVTRSGQNSMAGRGFAGGQRPPRDGDLDMRTLGIIWRVFVALTRDSSLGVAFHQGAFCGGGLSGGREEQEGTSIRT
jgi:hypothetical protein